MITKNNFKDWLRQAEADLESVKYNLQGKKYYVCANYSQQAVEKALKSLLLKKGILNKTHNITNMAKTLKLPEELISKISELEPVHQESVYPDVSPKIPAENYDEEDASNFFNIAKEVLEWIKKTIK